MNEVKDITGQKYGRLTVIGRDTSAPKGRSKWICRCDCGNTVSVYRNRLTCGTTISCGCAKKYVNLKDITGQRFGRLVAIERTEQKYAHGYIYKCKCDCGNVCFAPSVHLRQGSVKSCGCLFRETHQAKEARAIRDEYYIEGTDVLALSRGLQSNNTSGCKGVFFDKSVGLWKARITFRRHSYYLGSSVDYEKAVELRKAAEDRIHGDFLKWYSEAYPEQWEKLKKSNLP